jgi:putative intracellular protease/amidase
MADTEQVVADHHMHVDFVSSKPKRVLIVASNPTTATAVGWPVGFWAAELTHPYYELRQRGVEVTIASPEGGKVEMDALSDPRDASKVVGRRLDLDGVRQHPRADGAP